MHKYVLAVFKGLTQVDDLPFLNLWSNLVVFLAIHLILWSKSSPCSQQLNPKVDMAVPTVLDSDSLWQVFCPLVTPSSTHLTSQVFIPKLTIVSHCPKFTHHIL